MAIESPLKKLAEKARQDLELLGRLYNSYFSGGEDKPPREARKQVDALIAQIRTQAATSPNASDKFLANSVISRHLTLSVKWDKTLKAIEMGTVIRPKNS